MGGEGIKCMVLILKFIELKCVLQVPLKIPNLFQDVGLQYKVGTQ